MRRFVLGLALVCLFIPEAFGRNRYVPIAASAPGSRGTFFRTDLRIFNPSPSRRMDVTLHFLPQGQDGRNISGQVFQIAPRGTLVMDDVVEILVPESTPALGAIRIDSDTDASYPFAASTRTYTQSPASQGPGTFGQFIPALDPADALEISVVLHASITPGFRTNVGAMNPGSTPAAVRMILYDASGVLRLTSPQFEVLPMSTRQWSSLEVFGSTTLEDGVIVIESTVPIFTWGSIVDNASGDAIFVLGVEDEGAVIPAGLFADR